MDAIWGGEVGRGLGALDGEIVEKEGAVLGGVNV